MSLFKQAIAARFRRLAASVRNTFSRSNLKSLFTARSFTAGSYTAASCLAVIAIAAASVSFVESLPSTWVKIDLSENQTTTLSSSTVETLESLEDDVTIYLISEEGEEDEYLQLILEKYEDSSEKVNVVQKDPVLYPTFTSQYTNESLEDGSLIITYEDDFKIVSYENIYALNTSTFSYDFNGEAAITSAINSLTSEEMPVVYTLTGHGESDLPADVESDLETANIDTSQLNLLSEGSVPKDADAVIMYAPSNDLSEEEAAALLSYLEDGGSFLLLTDYDDGDMPNLAEVMDSYGVQAVNGLVVEGDSGYCMSGYPYYLLPEIENHDATESIAGSNSFVLMPFAHGITTIEQYRSSLTITPLLSTSSSAYVKTSPETAETLSKEDGDVAGETMLGVAISETVDDDETRVVWFSSTLFLDPQIDQRVGGVNTDLLISSLTWLCGIEDETLSLSSKSTGTHLLTVDASAASTLSVFFIGVVPAFFLLVGFQIWRSRKAQ